MAKILITHPIDPISIEKLALKKIHPSLKPKKELTLVSEEVFYVNNGDEEIFYVPSIAIKQKPDEANDPSLDSLTLILENVKPDVLIVGNNAVPGKAIAAWRKAVGKVKKLLAIRRGVDTRAIDKQAARKERVAIGNLPGINSPFVARHMIEYLKIYRASSRSKIAIIGVGNIGKNIALPAIKHGLSVHLLSPSLQDSTVGEKILRQRKIPADRVTCADSTVNALVDANYVAIAVPWENNAGEKNKDIISLEHIESLAPNARIVSASVPRIFSVAALSLMNDLVKQEKIYIRIDTAKRRAVEAKIDYPNLDIGHDRAFASSECQQELDNAMLQKARKFIENKTLELVR
ncbi:MAG: hypothetical protein QNJ38_08435 [Prochloraceae cyanobacterium]|nr:hypothetical protein [Prochloraceae cyanobacterium]